MIKPTPKGWTDNATALEWLEHFEKHTIPRTKGLYRLLILDGHDSHVNIKFDEYCKDHHIITLCLPAHSSHLLQPLDVGCFGPLKRAYSDEINAFIKQGLNHITKEEFLIALKGACQTAMSENNAKGGFRGAGLLPHNPQIVLNKLDIKLRTPTPTSPPNLRDQWTSQTPQNHKDVLLQSTLIKGQIARHQSSSPTPIFESVESLVKGLNGIIHNATLLQAEVKGLRGLNRTLGKRRRVKRYAYGMKEHLM